jgi:hypothetical protein
LEGAIARADENYKFHGLRADVALNAASGSRAILGAIVIARNAAMAMAEPSITSRVSSDFGYLSTINQKA